MLSPIATALRTPRSSPCAGCVLAPSRRGRAQAPPPAANACVDVPRDARRCDGWRRRRALFSRTGRPPRARLCVRRLPRRRTPAAGDKARAHDAARGIQGQARRAGADRDLRALPQRRRADAAASRRGSASTRRPSTPRACTASSSPTGDRNVATCASCHGAHGIRLVSDAKSPVFPTNVAAHLRDVPRGRRRTWPATSCADGTAAADQPVRRLSEERPLRRADQGQRSVGADVQRLPRQPRRGAARRRRGRQRVRHLPRGVRAEVRRRASTRRSSTRGAWSATATTPC